MISHENLIREHPRCTRRRFTPLARATSVILATLSISPVAAAQGPDTIVLTEVYRQQIVDSKGNKCHITTSVLLNSDRILVETCDNTLLLCDTLDGRVLWTKNVRDLVSDGFKFYRGDSSSIVGARYENDGSIGIIAGGEEFVGEYIRFDSATKDVVRNMLTGYDIVGLNAPYSMHKSQMLLPTAGFLRQRLYVFDLDNVRRIRELQKMPRRLNLLTSATFSPDGKYAAATGDSVWVWEVKSGRRLNDAYQPSKEVIDEWLRTEGGYCPASCAFSANNEMLVVGTRGDQLLFFEVKSGRLLKLVEDIPPGWDWDFARNVYFLGDTRFVLANAGPLGIYDFDRQKWLDCSTAIEGTERAMGPAHVHGDSIFFCDYAGKLRRYRWSVQQAPAGPPSADRTTQPSED